MVICIDGAFCCVGGWAGLGWAGLGWGGHSAGLKSLVSGAGEDGRGDYVGGRKGDGLYLYVGYLVGEKKCRGTCLKNIGSSPSGLNDEGNPRKSKVC